MDRIGHAHVFASQKHSGQKRKYTGDPYIVHPTAVAQAVFRKGGSEDMIIAALLHDTIEDTDATREEVQEHFGVDVAYLVWELTDRYTSEKYPNLNRATRKTMEADRLAGVSIEAKLIKFCDMADNTSTIVEHDPAFAKLYLAEKAYLAEVMGFGSMDTEDKICESNPATTMLAHEWLT